MTQRRSLEERVARIEARLAIQQLPIRYALAVDGRDLDAWVSLFVPDVDCGRWGQGRDALRRFIEPQVHQFYRSIHQICGHKIELTADDTATGAVYCRAEHEDRGRWIVMAICYFDEYQRVDGDWFFRRRRERHWYSTDVLERPHAPTFQHWDGHDDRPTLPHAFPTWNSFWAAADSAELETLTGAP